MKIISNFHDIYDYMMMYGQDEKLTFERINRHHININQSFVEIPVEDGILSSHIHVPPLSYFYPEHHAHFEQLWHIAKSELKMNVHKIYAVINGKPYMDMYLTTYTTTERSSQRNLTFEQLYEMVQKRSHELPAWKTIDARMPYQTWLTTKVHRWTPDDHKKDWSGYYLPLHQQFATPVFFISDKEYYGQNVAFKDLPLHYFGFEYLKKDVEHLYQDIAYCLGNVVHHKNEPPEAISDKTKIEQAGFDYVTSFRG